MRKSLSALGLGLSIHAYAATPNELLATYVAQAGQAAHVQKGEAFFKANHGREWACTSCHGLSPLEKGQHASTAKGIEPLAPASNLSRFTDAAKVEKWFRRNCKDVLGRECAASEKANVLAWLLTLR